MTTLTIIDERIQLSLMRYLFNDSLATEELKNYFAISIEKKQVNSRTFY